MASFSDCPRRILDVILDEMSNFLPHAISAIHGQGAGTLRGQRKGFWIAVLYLLIGALIGSLVGHLLASVWPPLGHNYYVVGSSPGTSWTFNFGIFGISVGAWLDLNLGGIIGLIGGLIWYQRRG